MSHQRDPYANVRRVQNRGREIDIHDMLRNEIYRQSGDPAYQEGPSASVPAPAIPNSVVPSTPPVGFEDIELYFDSTQRDSSSDYTAGEIRWSIPQLNNSQDIKNCIEMRLGTFYFPKIYATSGKPEYFYFRRVFLEFQGAPSTQAVLGANGNRYHFEFDVQNINGQSVKLVPLKDSFFFQRPLSAITDFQLRFMVPAVTSDAYPFKKIPLPHDTVTVNSLLTAGIGYNPIRFRITSGETTSVLGLVGSTGTPGVAVFISGYTSNSSATNTSVNSSEGVYVTNILNSTDFEISGINASAVTAEYTATMYIPKNRIAFPLRFTSVKDQFTNYIGVNHL
jgi:hypothetical protein